MINKNYFSVFFAAIISFSLFVSDLQAKEYQVAFYSDFEPISYSENRDPASPQFHNSQGYEVDLLKAIEAIPGSEMTFIFHGVKVWDNIWLMPYLEARIDIAMGGITREERRTLNDDGKKVVDVTNKTLTFKQSLLMNAEDGLKIKTHDDLTCAYVVGAVRGTTGEYRFLAQANMINNIDEGLIQKGVTVVMDNKEFMSSDGSLSIYDPKVINRSRLIPPDCSLPLVKYFVAEDSMIPALEDGFIDAIARGYIGNKLIADRSNGQLVVNAIYSLECPRQESISCKKKEEAVMFVKLDDQALLQRLNKYIDYLTDNGRIEYEDWRNNPSIFLERAKQFHNEK
jgi:hypothetical protein